MNDAKKNLQPVSNHLTRMSLGIPHQVFRNPLISAERLAENPRLCEKLKVDVRSFSLQCRVLLFGCSTYSVFE